MAQKAFWNCDLGDPKINRHLIDLTGRLAKDPAASINKVPPPHLSGQFHPNLAVQPGPPLKLQQGQPLKVECFLIRL